MKNIFLIVSALILFGNGNTQSVYDTKSPDGHITVKLLISKEGQLSYTLTANENNLINASLLGLNFGEAGYIPSAGWQIDNTTENKARGVWKPIWGKRSEVSDNYNETIVGLSGSGSPFNKFRVAVRAYNDGVAFRYEIPIDAKGDTAMAKGELTSFSFAGDYTSWFYNGEQHNLGPDKLTLVNGDRRPVMTIRAGEQSYMAIHEADLRTGDPLILNSKMGETVFTVVSSPGNIQPGYISPWRVIFYGKTPGAMVDSHLIELLNPDPPAGMDFSWVKPGVSMWDRRITGARVGDFTYKWSSYPSWARLVDFAAQKGIPYLVIDSDWYGPQFTKEANPVNGGRAEDVKKLIAYAKRKNVKIWLYINDVAIDNYPIEETFGTYREWGVAGIKYGFMRGKPAVKNARTRMITETCARYQLLCDFHDGPVHPYGQMRTWPNAVTREFCAAQLDSRRFYQPKTFVTSVFVNMLAGPLDMTNGVFELLLDKKHEIYKGDVPSTVVSEAARTLIVFSGITMLVDIPENFNKYPELISFISSQKMPWAESKTLLGEIGEYIVMARKSSDGTWLVGAATNESARELEIPLSFLGKGKHKVTIITDGDNADYRTNRTEYHVDTKRLRSEDFVRVKLAAGGGACLIIKER